MKKTTYTQIFFPFLLLFSCYIAICKPGDFSFLNDKCNLWIVSIITMLVFTIPVLPFKCINISILKFIKRNYKYPDKLAQKIYKSYHSEIKQTFTFNFAMFLSPILLGKNEAMNSNTLLVTYATIAVYTCLFSLRPFVRADKNNIKKITSFCKITIVVSIIISLLINSYLLYLGWNKQGDFYWVFSWCLVVSILFIQLWKSSLSVVDESSNTERISTQKSEFKFKSYTQSNKSYSKHPNSRKPKKKK